MFNFKQMSERIVFHTCSECTVPSEATDIATITKFPRPRPTGIVVGNVWTPQGKNDMYIN